MKRYHIPGHNKTLTVHEQRDPLCGFSRNIYRPFRWLWQYIDCSHRGIDQQGRREHRDQFLSFLRGLITSNTLQYDSIRVLCQHLQHFSIPFFVNDQEICNYTRTPFFQTIRPPPEQNLLTFDWLPHDCVDL